MKGRFVKVFETDEFGQVLLKLEPNPSAPGYMAIEFDGAYLTEGAGICRAEIQMPMHSSTEVVELFESADFEIIRDFVQKMGDHVLGESHAPPHGVTIQ